MPAPDIIQSAFSGGEISGRMAGRVDLLEVYRKSTRYQENWESFVQGSMRLRPGTRWVGSPSGLNDRSRLIGFQTRLGGDYVVLLSNEKLRVWDDTHAVAGAQDGSIVVNGAFDQGSVGWTLLDGWVSYWGGCVDLASVNDAPNEIGQTLVPVASGSHTLRIRASVVGDLKIKIGTTLGDDDILAEQTITGVPPYQFKEYSFTFTGTLGLDSFLSIRSDAGSMADMRVDYVTVYYTGAAALDLTTPWTDADLEGLQYVQDTGKDRIIFVHEKYEPRVLERAATGVWSFNPVSTAGAGGTSLWTSKPGTWTGSNWPSVVDIHQGRLWIGAPPDARSTFWGSKSGSYFDFTIGSNPGDAFSYIAATRGAFQWFRGQRTMLSGTDRSEVAITAANIIVGPGDVDVREESAYGSAAIQACVAGEMTLYVTPDERRVRGLIYEFQTQGWNSQDLTLLAEHITEGRIKEIHYGRDPNGAIIALLRTGEIRFCTFDRQEKTNAWWRWVTAGRVYSAAVSYRATGSWMWVLVDRGGTVHLEQVGLGEDGDTQYFDSYQTVDAREYDEFNNPIGPGKVLTGLSRFNGQSVGIILDGALQPSQVVTGGTVTMLVAGTTAVVGLLYRAKARTLPPEGGNPAGTSMGMLKRRVDIGARLNDSALPLLNGRRPQGQRSPGTPMNLSEPRMTGDVVVRNSGYSTGAEVLIEQDLPVRTEVCAIFSTLQQDKV